MSWWKPNKHKEAFIEVLRYMEKKSRAKYPSLPLEGTLQDQVKYLKREIDHCHRSLKWFRQHRERERDYLEDYYRREAKDYLNSLVKLRSFYARLKERCSRLRAENQSLKAQLEKYKNERSS